MRQQHAAEPLERRLGNVVAVQQASRLVESAQVERQLGFQHLVRRYVSPSRTVSDPSILTPSTATFLKYCMAASTRPAPPPRV